MFPDIFRLHKICINVFRMRIFRIRLHMFYWYFSQALTVTKFQTDLKDSDFKTCKANPTSKTLLLKPFLAAAVAHVTLRGPF